ncbi:MAG: hypothetical protein V3T43_03155 [Nitrosomonadaceae bacterium]
MPKTVFSLLKFSGVIVVPPDAKVDETGIAVAVERCLITGSWKTVGRPA